MTRAERAGLRLEDVPRPSLARCRHRHQLDAQVRQALGLVLSGGDDGRRRRDDRMPASQPRPTPMRLRLCRACQRVVIATTEKPLRTKLKAHRRTCRLVGRSTVSIGHV
jgi:hypothetical protein